MLRVNKTGPHQEFTKTSQMSFRYHNIMVLYTRVVAGLLWTTNAERRWKEVRNLYETQCDYIIQKIIRVTCFV